MSVIIDREFSHLTPKGPRWKLYLFGETFIKSSRDPIHEAARECVKRGITGRLQMRDKKTGQMIMEGLIAVLADKTCYETQTGIVTVKYKPHPKAL